MLVGTGAADKVVSLLTGFTGVNATLAELAATEGLDLAPLGPKQVMAQNVSIDLAERSFDMKYPSVHVYCEGLKNVQKEKFRTFSGTVQMVIEIRVSQDRLEGLERRLQLQSEAVLIVLNRNRGDWGDGMFYGGGYEAAFGPVKHGGKHFVQVAKITFDVGVSRN